MTPGRRYDRREKLYWNRVEARKRERQERERLVWVSIKQYDSYARRVFRANIRAYGTSLSEASLARFAPVAEIRDSMIAVPNNWRELIKAARPQAEGASA